MKQPHAEQAARLKEAKASLLRSLNNLLGMTLEIIGSGPNAEDADEATALAVTRLWSDQEER